MSQRYRSLVRLAIAVLVIGMPTVSGATPPTALTSVPTDLPQCVGLTRQQAAHIAEVETELDRNRAMVADLQRQVTALRKQGDVRPPDAGTTGAAPPGPGTEADALNAQGAQLFARGDAEGAAPLFRRAAQAGHLGAMVNLALLYLNGRGMPQDPRQAVALLERGLRARQCFGVREPRQHVPVRAGGLIQPRPCDRVLSEGASPRLGHRPRSHRCAAGPAATPVSDKRTNEERIRDRLRRRRRRLRALLKRMPRRASLHRIPVLRRWAHWARSRPDLWRYRRPNLTVAIYAGSLLAMTPLMGAHALLALPIAWLVRANLAVILGLQLLNNLFTAAPLLVVTYWMGEWPLKLLSRFTHLPLPGPIAATALGVLITGLLLGALFDGLSRILAWRHRSDLIKLAQVSRQLECIA